MHSLSVLGFIYQYIASDLVTQLKPTIKKCLMGLMLAVDYPLCQQSSALVLQIYCSATFRYIIDYLLNLPSGLVKA